MSTVAAVAPPAARTLDNKWLVTLSVGFGALMATIDLSIVNVALPQIRGSIGASIDEMAALATSFAIAQVIVMPLTAFMGQFFGQKRVYLFCLALFVAASAVCGLVRTLPQLVVARAIQGFGAGALQPTQQAILRQTFPAKEQGMAMAMFGMVVVLGPAVGPTLGGWIVDNWSWPWIFFINLPVGLVGVLMVSRFVHEPDDLRRAQHAAAARARKDLDWLGIALMSVGFASLQYVLEEGPREDWFDSALVSVLVATAVFALVGFVVRELTARAPAVNLRLFRDSVFSSATLIGGVMFAILMGNMFLLPVFMQEVLGFTALQSGLALMPRSLVMMLAFPIVGRLYNQVPPRVLVSIGVIAVALGSWMMGEFTVQTSTADVTIALIVQGLGFSLLFVPLTTVALAHVGRRHISEATGLNSVVRQLGGSMGLAIFTTLLTDYIVQARTAIVPHLDPTRPEVMQRLAAIEAGLRHRGWDVVGAHRGALRVLEGQVMRQASVLAFDKTFQLGALMMLALIPLVMLLRHPPAGEEHEVKTHAEME